MNLVPECCLNWRSAPEYKMDYSAFAFRIGEDSVRAEIDCLAIEHNPPYGVGMTA